MKILITCVSKFTFDKFIKKSAEALVADGHEVTIGLGERYTTYGLTKIKFIELPLIRRGPVFKFISAIIETSKILRNAKYDLVNVHTPVAAFAIRLALFFNSKMPITYTVHGFYFHENMPTFKRMVHIISELLLSVRTSSYIFVSLEDKKFLEKMLFFRRRRDFSYVPNKIAAKRFLFDPIKRLDYRNTIGLDDNVSVFGMVCRINPEKGIIEFLNVAMKLINEGRNCHFLIVGDIMKNEVSSEFGNLFGKLRKELGDNLTVTGFVENVEEFLFAIDVFCLPSYREGYPVSLIEASSAGCQCLATNIRGCREISLSDPHIKLVPPKNVNALYDTLSNFCTNNKFDAAERFRRSVEMGIIFGEDPGVIDHNQALILHHAALSKK